MVGKKMTDKTEEKNMFLTDQALGAVMMALQRSLMDQSDIVPILKGFKFRLSEEGLMVLNPPLVKFNEDTQGINTDNYKLFIECGPGRVLQGLVKKINRDMDVSSI